MSSIMDIYRTPSLKKSFSNNTAQMMLPIMAATVMTIDCTPYAPKLEITASFMPDLNAHQQDQNEHQDDRRNGNILFSCLRELSFQ